MHSISHLLEPAAAMRFEHKHIANIGDRGEIADHPGKAHLCAVTIINAKAQRMLDRPRPRLRGIPFAQ